MWKPLQEGSRIKPSQPSPAVEQFNLWKNPAYLTALQQRKDQNALLLQRVASQFQSKYITTLKHYQPDHFRTDSLAWVSLLNGNLLQIIDDLEFLQLRSIAQRIALTFRIFTSFNSFLLDMWDLCRSQARPLDKPVSRALCGICQHYLDEAQLKSLKDKSTCAVLKASSQVDRQTALKSMRSEHNKNEELDHQLYNFLKREHEVMVGIINSLLHTKHITERTFPEKTQEVLRQILSKYNSHPELNASRELDFNKHYKDSAEVVDTVVSALKGSLKEKARKLLPWFQQKLALHYHLLLTEEDRSKMVSTSVNTMQPQSIEDLNKLAKKIDSLTLQLQGKTVRLKDIEAKHSIDLTQLTELQASNDYYIHSNRRLEKRLEEAQHNVRSLSKIIAELKLKDSQKFLKSPSFQKANSFEQLRRQRREEQVQILSRQTQTIVVQRESKQSQTDDKFQKQLLYYSNRIKKLENSVAQHKAQIKLLRAVGPNDDKFNISFAEVSPAKVVEYRTQQDQMQESRVVNRGSKLRKDLQISSSDIEPFDYGKVVRKKKRERKPSIDLQQPDDSRLKSKAGKMCSQSRKSELKMRSSLSCSGEKQLKFEKAAKLYPKLCQLGEDHKQQAAPHSDRLQKPAQKQEEPQINIEQQPLPQKSNEAPHSHRSMSSVSKSIQLLPTISHDVEKFRFSPKKIKQSRFSVLKGQPVLKKYQGRDLVDQNLQLLMQAQLKQQDIIPEEALQLNIMQSQRNSIASFDGRKSNRLSIPFNFQQKIAKLHYGVQTITVRRELEVTKVVGLDLELKAGDEAKGDSNTNSLQKQLQQQQLEQGQVRQIKKVLLQLIKQGSLLEPHFREKLSLKSTAETRSKSQARDKAALGKCLPKSFSLHEQGVLTSTKHSQGESTQGNTFYKAPSELKAGKLVNIIDQFKLQEEAAGGVRKVVKPVRLKKKGAVASDLYPSDLEVFGGAAGAYQYQNTDFNGHKLGDGERALKIKRLAGQLFRLVSSWPGSRCTGFKHFLRMPYSVSVRRVQVLDCSSPLSECELGLRLQWIFSKHSDCRQFICAHLKGFLQKLGYF